MKYNTLYYVLLLVFIPALLIAQEHSSNPHIADSLENLFNTYQSDTSKSLVLNQLSDFYSESDSVKATAYARESMRLSKGFPTYYANARFFLAGAYFYFDVEKSKEEYLKVIDLLKSDTSHDALLLTARAWRNYGSLIQRQGKKEEFMEILVDNVLPLSQRIKDTLREGLALADIGLIFENNLDYKKAIEYYQNSIRLLRHRSDAAGFLPYTYIRLAANYLYNKQPGEAVLNLKEVRKILSPNTPSFDWGQFHLTQGMYYSAMDQTDKALNEFDSASTLSHMLGLRFLSSNIGFQKFKTLDKAGRVKQARNILLEYYNDSTVYSIPENRLLYLYHIAKTEERLGNPREAYQWLLKYAVLADSINDEKLRSKVEALEMSYQTEKKERNILQLQNENKEQQITLQKRRNLNVLLISGIIILILVLSFIYQLYNNNKKHSRQAASIHQQQLKQMEQEQQMKLYNAILEGQEKERKRMAQDLHDGLGGILAGIKLKLTGLGAEENGKVKKSVLDRVIRQLDSSITELRRIARNMMPETLIRFGVETAIQDLCDSLQTPKVRVEFQAYDLKKDLSQKVQLTIYRIAQELLTNAIRHGQANNIFLQCSQNNDTIFLTVEDNGAGFDPDSINKKKGLGLSNIQNRINILKGNMEIESSPGTGTTVNVEMNAYG